VPVLSTPEGALGERVARHGGGWLLPPDFDGATVARRLVELVAQEAELARVKSLLARPDAGRIPPLDEMARSLDALYDRFGIDAGDPGSSDAASIERLVAANLDGSLFRPELARLADELARPSAAMPSSRTPSRRRGASRRRAANGSRSSSATWRRSNPMSSAKSKHAVRSARRAHDRKTGRRRSSCCRKSSGAGC
jgi:hypothetical protein